MLSQEEIVDAFISTYSTCCVYQLNEKGWALLKELDINAYNRAKRELEYVK